MLKRSMIIGEVAQSHDGSLGMAHAFIDAIAAAGADAVKFQTHIAEAESTPAEPWRVKFSPQDETRFDYWKRMEFTSDQWMGLKKHATDKGLKFISSPFSLQAMDILTNIDIEFWKVASGEISNTLMLDRMVKSGLPLLISTGMSPISEIDAIVERVIDKASHLTILQCTSMYPTPPEKVGLNMIPLFKERYGCDVGLSDHSGTIYAGLAAAVLGVNVIEVHVTLSKEMFGPDVVASITTSELRQLVEGVRFIEAMKSSSVDKNALADDLSGMRRIFSKSLVTVTNLKAGDTLKEEYLTGKKPGTGILVSQMSEVIGKRILRDLPANTILQTSDFEDENP